jgi:hypothetical protein
VAVSQVEVGAVLDVSCQRGGGTHHKLFLMLVGRRLESHEKPGF